MTNPTGKNDDSTVMAIERAGGLLAAADRNARVFLEERSDVRLILDSDAGRDMTVTCSRGASIGGRRSIHVTDPSDEELIDLASSHGEGLINFPRRDLNTKRETPAEAAGLDWSVGCERALLAQAEHSFHGRTGAGWSATIIEFRQRIWVADRTGRVQKDLRRGCRGEVRVWLDEHPNLTSATDFVLGADSVEPPIGVFDRMLARVERKRLGGLLPQPGETCAIFAPGVGGMIAHELVGHAMEGDILIRRQTWIQSVALEDSPSLLTVLDDPRRARGAWSVDDEGVASEETLLLDEGRPVGVLLDLDSAEGLRKRSNGHGRRSSYLTAVKPRMGCTFIAAGEHDPAELLKETRSGVFVHRMSAGYADPFAGRASFVVTDADRIVAGRLDAPLEPFLIELDGVDAWRSIDRVGIDLAFDTCVGSCVRDGQPLAVSVGAPTIRVGVIRVVC